MSGVTSIRPATTVYARTETAYALLSESFQQILAQFAKQIDPSIDIFDLFPNFRHKLDQSQVLRKEIYTISQIVRLAEKEPDGRNAVVPLHKELALGTLRSILKQAGLGDDAFRELL